MKTYAIKESPLITLNSSCYNGNSDLEVTKKMLVEADIGKIFTPDYNACGRSQNIESLKVVYKDIEGCACVLSTERSSDSPNPDHWREEDKLIWFQFI